MSARSLPLTIAAIIALVFGVLTILSGGRALFGGADMGAVVSYVLWFNFFAGFAYVAAGVGLWRSLAWAPALSVIIATATGAVMLAFLWRVWQGGAYETRTMGAMLLRLAVWVTIAFIAWRHGKRL